MHKKYIPNKDLLDALLAGPYSHFKKIGADDWRDPNQNNSSLSISEKGYIDHKSEISGSLWDLGKQLNLRIADGNDNPPKNNPSQTIWSKSEVAKQPDSRSFQLAKSYFTKHRKIPIESYSDLIRKGLIRAYEFKGELMLVYPSLTPETAALAIQSNPFAVRRIQRIFLNPDGSKHQKGKRHLGSNQKDSAAFIIPPLNNKDVPNHAVVFEGLEDALSLRTQYPGSWFFVATDKAGLKHVTGFFENKKFKECLIIADHDTDVRPEVTGQALAWQLGQTIEHIGIKVTVKMPPKPKEDANSALQSGKLREWIDGLIDIPDQFRIDQDRCREVKDAKEYFKKYGLRIQKASDVKIRPIKWLWPGVLAQGKLVIIAGDPGLGKSQVCLFISAIVSTGGEWPVSEETCDKGSVLILSAEDGAEDTIVPRLNAVSADLEHIHIVHAVKLDEKKERAFDFTKDVEQLRHTVKRIDNVRLIVVDPISAYMGKTDSHRNAEVRAALTPAVEFAEEIGACLLCVTHLNKGRTGNALSRITGSIAFIAAARASFLVSRDNDDPDRRLMLPLKNNLAKDTHGFGYRIEEHNLSGIETSNVTWEKDSVDLTAEEVLSDHVGRLDNRGNAENFLLQELAGGLKIPCKELYERAEEMGISPKVLWTVKDKIGVQANKVDFKGGWVWHLPLEVIPEDYLPPKIPEDSQSNNSNLGESSQTTITEII